MLSILLLIACENKNLNNPYRKSEKSENIFYSVFAERPKTLDPARAYSSNEYLFIAQIYEPPFQYHYLKRPYTLIPLTATSVIKPTYYNREGKPLSQSAPANQIAFSQYTIQIQPGILYQPHPAFAKNKEGRYRYQNLTKQFISNINSISDFKYTGTRELTAEDYIYEIKRLASPYIQSPIEGIMGKYILGFDKFAKQLKKSHSNDQKGKWIDLRQFPLEGLKLIDRYTYQVTLKGTYPQFIYWLAMPFFSPMPWEAEKFYSQPGLEEKNITLDWYPVGSGPYMLIENNPNRRMVLVKNPNFHGEEYPSEGEPRDKDRNLLTDKGKKLPFIDKFVFSLEKESIPMWNKFLQGYYDQSGIGSDNFDQAIQVDKKGRPYLTPKLQNKNIRLQTSVEPSIFYMGFNMQDNIVGGYNESASQLRQAIAIAIDFDEFITIFLNGRGIPAQNPIPPGIFGYTKGEEGLNHYIYDWVEGRAKRKPISIAKKLLAKAGYPNGINKKTGQPLILNYDVAISGDPTEKARLAWIRKRLEMLGIQLNIRATQYNRFQEKMRTGNAQLFSWGWHADYPDPENFLFLLYGPNGKVKYGGENAANYSNPEFDKLFEKMKALPNGPERKAIIRKMLTIIEHDTPWIWGYHPKQFQLTHSWIRTTKPNAMANNTLKYIKLNPKERMKLRQKWNKPIWWPIWLIIILIIIAIIPVVFHYWRREYKTKTRI